MAPQSMRIAIVVGEVSGDILGAGLLKQLKQQYPHATFEGIGGENMLAQGFHSLFDMEELSVMGLVEVLSRIRRLLSIRAQLVQHFIENPPDVFIGIDAPDFNLGLAAKLKKQGIKTAHYVSPTVWAWRENRVHKIKRAVDLVLCLFPFEPAIYQKYQVAARFVGHTLADQIPLAVDQQAARTALSLPEHAPILAILPGSRGAEVAKLFGVFLATATQLSNTISDLQVVVPVVNQKRRAQIDELLKEQTLPFKLTLIDGNARDVMVAANAVLLASGTATLEAMLCKRPMVVAYKLAPITHWLMGYLYKQDYFALPNILSGEELVPELLQEDVNPENLAAKLQRYFTTFLSDHAQHLENSEHDAQALEALQLRFVEIHQALQQNADKQAALAVQSLIDGSQ